MTYNVIYVSGSTASVQINEVGSVIESTGTYATVLTIPAASNIGAYYYLYNNSPTSFTAQSTSGIFGGPIGSNSSSLSVSVGSTAYIFSDGSNWIASSIPNFETPIPNTGITPGTYNTLVVQADGRVTAGFNTSYISTNGGLLIGELYGTTGSFSGAFVAASGSFSTVSASSGSFSNFVSTTGTFTGALNSGTFTTSGIILNGPGTFNGIVTAPTPPTNTNTNQLATTAFVNSYIGNLTTEIINEVNVLNQNVSVIVSGAATGSGNILNNTITLPLVLANTGVTAGTFNNIIVNSKGLAVGGTNIPYLTTLTLSEVTTALGYTPTTPIISSAGTYNNLIINSAGQVVSGSSVSYLTGINSSQVTTALGYTPSTPIVSSAGTYNNLIINSAGQVVSGSSVSYLTANQTISVNGDVSGSGTTAITLTLASISTPGTYNSVVVNSKGLITQGTFIPAQVLNFSAIVAGLGYIPATPVVSTSGTYNTLTINSSGQVIGGTNIPYLTGITSNQVTSALGFTPTTPVISTSGTYNNLIINSAGQVTGGNVINYLTGITSSQVTTALGFTPTTPVISTSGTYNNLIINNAGQVTGGNYITYLTEITENDVSNALGFTPTSPINSTSGTYNSVVINSAGQVVSGSSFAYLTNNQNINISGDATGSGSTSISITLASSGVTAGTYNNIVVNAKGLATRGTNINYLTGITSSEVTTALGYIPSTPVISTSGTYNTVIINGSGQVTSGQYISYLTGTYSEIIAALGFTPVATTTLGAANGVATLNGSGQLSTAQIPSSLLGANIYQGTWNASANSPTLTNGVGTKGYYYIVSVAGSTSLDGISSWNVGDQAIFNGTMWQKIAGVSAAVTSVAGRTGAITLSVSDITGAAPLASPVFTGNPTSTGSLSISDNSNSFATTSFVKGQGYLTANQQITVLGDVTGVGSTAIILTLASIATAGTYNSVIINSKGLVVSGTNINYLTGIDSSAVTTALGFAPTPPLTSSPGTYNNLIINNAGQVVSGSNVSYLTGNQSISITGAATGSGSTSISLTLATSGVTPGTYSKHIVNEYGLVTQGLSLASADITSALGYTPSAPVVSTAGTYNNSIINSAGQVIGGTNIPYLTGITSSQVTTALGYTPSMPVISTAGTYNNLIVNSAGQVTGGSSISYLTGINSSQVTTALGYVPSTPVVSTSGTYNTITVNSSGQVISGTNIQYLTGITSSQVTTALGYIPSTPVISTAGTYNNLIVNSAGQVTGGSSVSYLTANQSISVSGDVTGSGTTAIALTLAATGVTAGTYNGSIVVNSKGLITSASALGSSDVTTALGYTPFNQTGGTISGNVSVNATLTGTTVNGSTMNVSGTMTAAVVSCSILLSPTTLSENYTVPDGFNATMTGPVTITIGNTFTIPTDSGWKVV